MKKKRAVVLQSGGSTAVINQSLAGVIDAAKKSGCFSALFGARFGTLGLIKGDWFNLAGTAKARIKNLRQSPSSALGTSREKVTPEKAGMIFEKLRRAKINVVFFIGGNDSAQTALTLSRLASGSGFPLQVIGIPKTIDNDLPGMDHAPGYGSVARFMAIATQEASLDTKAIRSSDPIKIIEAMGRNSGWIAAAASLGKTKSEDGPHLLYFPERAFDQNKFLEDVSKVYKRYGWVLIVISETIRDAQGKRIGSGKALASGDAFGHPYVEGAAQYLCHFLESKLRVRARFDKPGTIQRMSIPYISAVDQKETYQCGVHAVKLVLEGKTGLEVSIKRVSTNPYRAAFGAISLHEVAGTEKYLPDSFINREGNFVTPAFRRYALPLIGGPLPRYVSWV